jgi:hypothetical protein
MTSQLEIVLGWRNTIWQFSERDWKSWANKYSKSSNQVWGLPFMAVAPNPPWNIATREANFKTLQLEKHNWRNLLIPFFISIRYITTCCTPLARDSRKYSTYLGGCIWEESVVRPPSIWSIHSCSLIAYICFLALISHLVGKLRGIGEVHSWLAQKSK